VQSPSVDRLCIGLAAPAWAISNVRVRKQQKGAKT